MMFACLQRIENACTGALQTCSLKRNIKKLRLERINCLFAWGSRREVETGLRNGSIIEFEVQHRTIKSEWLHCCFLAFSKLQLHGVFLKDAHVNKQLDWVLMTQSGVSRTPLHYIARLDSNSWQNQTLSVSVLRWPDDALVKCYHFSISV